MSSISRRQQPDASPPESLHRRAEENLKFIRTAMETASSFTGISGTGYMLGGITALVATWVAAQQATAEGWLAVWLLEACLAFALILWLTARKSRRQGSSLLSAAGKRLLFAFVPPMAAGVVLTSAYFMQGRIEELPGIWFLLYGAATMTGGAYSIILIPVMGATFFALGATLMVTQFAPALVFGLGMSGIHFLFGILVWRNHGG